MITSTPNQDNDQFAQIWKAAEKRIDEYGNEREVGANGFRSYISHWSEHPDRDEAWAEEERNKIGEERFLREMECCHGDTKITILEGQEQSTATVKQLFDSL